jgi:hypothetical protein
VRRARGELGRDQLQAIVPQAQEIDLNEAA